MVFAESAIWNFSNEYSGTECRKVKEAEANRIEPTERAAPLEVQHAVGTRRIEESLVEESTSNPNPADSYDIISWETINKKGSLNEPNDEKTLSDEAYSSEKRESFHIGKEGEANPEKPTDSSIPLETQHVVGPEWKPGSLVEERKGFPNSTNNDDIITPLP